MVNNETSEKNLTRSRTWIVLVIVAICTCIVVFQLRGCRESGQTKNSYKQKIDSLQTEIHKAENRKVQLDQRADSLHKQLVIYNRETIYLRAKTTELKAHRSAVQYVIKELPDSSLITTFTEELGKFDRRRELP